MPSPALRAVLVSFREPGDPMAAQEHRCFLRAAGLSSLERVDAAATPPGPELLDADLLIFGGSGEYSVLDDLPWVKRGLDFLLQVADSGVPAWASCFGFQGLVLALGGAVRHEPGHTIVGPFGMSLTEQGRQDPILGLMPPTFRAMLGHKDHVRVLPSGVTLLATGPGGSPQALRVQGSQLWGAQFHPDLDRASILERWAHYREHYLPDRAEEIEREMLAGSDTAEVAGILRELVGLARGRARARA